MLLAMNEDIMEILAFQQTLEAAADDGRYNAVLNTAAVIAWEEVKRVAVALDLDVDGMSGHKIAILGGLVAERGRQIERRS